MCGLFGITHLPKNGLPKAQTALASLAHRGPDGGSHALIPQADHLSTFVGHRRLSIIDLSTNGTQPMQSGHVTITVNGEIYNYKQLRTELIEKHGAVFHSDSDSEVMLHGYIAWGIDEILKRADGMFALALVDAEKQQVILARDAVGIKPMHYGLLSGQLTWGSELKAIATYYGPDTLEHDHTAIYDFLTYGYVPTPKTIYKNIHKLPAASYLTFHTITGKHTINRYWSLKPHRPTLKSPSPTSPTTLKDAQIQVRAALGKSVKDQLVADVTLGAFLSGGTDSSIVCAEAVKHVKGLVTCSIGFEDERVDETHYAAMVAAALGTNHKTQRIGHANVNNVLNKLRNWFDEPFADTSAFPTHTVSALAKKHMTVVLTGDGGDEVFGGYPHHTDWYQALTPWLGFLFFLKYPVAWARFHTRGPLQRLARKLEPFTMLDPLERRARLWGRSLHHYPFKKALRKAWNIPENYDDYWHMRQHFHPELPRRSRALFLDFHTILPDNMLTKVDRTSMDVAIEARVPFLSRDVIEMAWNIPEEILFHNKELKGLLKSSYEDMLPRAALYRTKQGFSVGKAKKGDRLHVPHNATITEKLLTELFPDLLP